MRTMILGLFAVMFGAGEALAETRSLTLPRFDAVAAAAGVDVEIALGGPQSVLLEGEPQDFDRMNVRVENGVLKVSPRPRRGFNDFRGGPDVFVRVTAPAIRAVEASSAADVTLVGVAGGELTLEASSGADVTASGTCARLTARASSGADIEAARLACAFVEADASSGADVLLKAASEMTLSASSGADVLVKGRPGQIRQSASSGGDVRIDPR